MCVLEAQKNTKEDNAIANLYNAKYCPSSVKKTKRLKVEPKGALIES